ncbi:energy-coupling factor ABC transporter permease [Streptomyces sp. ACA25]|uniref:energy-coupling factor ABC transporter permease n=1 Tax=Streptomyces sp. ACA25 TaxID=3022596 RepID=UPI002307D305|nr:energy-coupling factor ABC transporter permease [Streptomyces sp. ACA25]MDB1087275.1 energy-coupling factor ABC transporter permease [Streptomyces sp. ACA25]
MHVPDGFFDAPVSVAAGAVAVTAVAVSLRGARRELDERTAPLAGLVAAFVFAVQMLTFPVGAGTSGHLMGGALAAILVGPFTGVLVLAVVLLIQALLFADGGLTALGINITLLGVVAVLVAWIVFRGLLRVLPDSRRSVTAAAFTAAFLSVPAAAAVFTGLYALGGTADIAIGRVFAAMVGVHTAIGVGEGVITAMTVGAVLAVRPDLVHGMRTARPGQRSVRPVWIAGLAATAVCAGLVSAYASDQPDGLERVAEDHGIDEREREHDLAGSPLEDYGVSGLDNETLSVGLAGLIGVSATLAAGTAAFVVLRRRRTDTPQDSEAQPAEQQRSPESV